MTGQRFMPLKTLFLPLHLTVLLNTLLRISLFKQHHSDFACFQLKPAGLQLTNVTFLPIF